MEPLLKRPRLFAPDKADLDIAYNLDNYTDLDDDEDGPLEIEEDGQEVEDDSIFDQGDPDAQLEHNRAQLDLKLKSKFEAIFEKYGRDFTGIGDEIDLRTGEIVVDNGHLVEMEDERDDGTGRPSLLEVFTQEPDDTIGTTEAEDDEQDEVYESHVKLKDMEEDDMILFQNTAVPSDRPETPPLRSALVQNWQSDQQEDNNIASSANVLHPTESEILAQFGKDLGPKIAWYVSQQRAQDPAAIEPVWQTLGLPMATPGKRPILKSILLQPDSDRSPSPQGSSSVWAPKKPRGRPRRDGADVAAIFRGETIIRDRTWYSSGYVSTTVTKQRTERVGLNPSKHIMSMPLKESLSGGKSKLEASTWAPSRRSESNDMYKINDGSDQELDSSEEKVAKFYKPRRPRSNPSLPVKQGGSGSLKLQSYQPRQMGKDGISAKRSHVFFTEADDKAILEWVKEALKKGYNLWSPTHWKMLAEMNPRHSHGSWMNRYYKRFWQKGVVLSTEEQNVGELLETGPDESQAGQQIVCDSQSDLGECSSSDESSHEVLLQDAPPIGPINILGKSPSPKHPGEDLKVDVIDQEVLDPGLRSSVVSDVTKKERPDSLLQQRSKLSQSPAIDVKRRTSLPCIAIASMCSAESPRSSSVPQKFCSKAETLSLSSPEKKGLAQKAVDIDTDSQDVAIESNKTVSEIESHQITFSTGTGLDKKRGKMPQRGQKQQQVLQKALDSSYDFSDEEDEIESGRPPLPFNLQVPDVVARRRTVGNQIIDLTIEDSDPTKNITPDRRACKFQSRNWHQAPITISSSSSASGLSDVEEEKFFLEPTTPKAPGSDSNMTLSGILGSDDFEELRRSSPISLKQTPHGKVTGWASQDIRKNSFKGWRSSPARKPTPKMGTPTGTIKHFFSFSKITSPTSNIVIANVGIGSNWASASSTSISELEKHFLINAIGSLILFQTALPLLKASCNPRFISVTSVLGSMGFIGNAPLPSSACGSSKAALNFLTRKIHQENTELIAFVVHPEWSDTELGSAGAEAAGLAKAPDSFGGVNIESLVALFDSATREKSSGYFLSYDGTELPW